MRTGRLVFLLVGFMALVLVTSSLPIGNGAEEDRAIVEKAIRDSIGWAQTKDRPLLESVLSQTEDFFIFHPDSKSTVVGYESFETRFEGWMDPRFKATRFDVRDLRINFSNSADVAWFTSILDDCAEWDGKPMCWEETRWTGVLEKRDNRWVIVQMHFSLASDKVRAEASHKETLRPASWSVPVSQKPSFKIEGWEKRLNKRQPPVKIMDAIGAAPGKMIGEIGAGTGRMTLWLAERVGKSGKIYANDIDKGDLQHLQDRAERAGFRNVETIVGDVDDPKLPVGALDITFMINVYHHLDEPLPLLRNIVPSLKSDGVLAIVECDPDKVDWGEEEGCHQKKVMVKELEDAGYEIVQIDTSLNEDNIYLARPVGKGERITSDSRSRHRTMAPREHRGGRCLPAKKEPHTETPA